MFNIKFDKEVCIGCQACASVCDNWIRNNDKVKPKKVKMSEFSIQSLTGGAPLHTHLL